MESEPASTHHKARLVTCPKCRLLLRESADIPIYQCGGCGTVLQVKNRKKDAKSTASGICKSDVAQMSELNRVFEVGECSSSSQNAIHSSSGEHSLDQSNGRDEKISRDCSTKNSGDVHSSVRDPNNGRGESSSSSQKAILSSSDECSLHQDNGSTTRISNDSSTESSGDVNSSDGDQNNESDHNESQDCNVKQPGVSIEFCSPTGDACHDNEEMDQFAEPNSKVVLNATISLLPGAKLAVDSSSGSDSTLRSSNTDTLPQMENNSTVASHRPAAESISSDAFISSPDERPKQLQSSVNLRYERRDFFSPRSDISCKTEYFKSKSSTFRSSHEYDGDVSSFDGTDDHVPDQHINLYSTYKVMNSVISEERSGRGKFLENRIVNGNSRMQHQARNLSSTLPDKRPYTSNYRKWDGDELVGSTAHGLTVTRGTGLRDEEFPLPLPFYQRDYSASYESGRTSSQLQDEFHHRSSEQEKIKLLRLVYELQDRINKTCHVNEKAHRRVSSGVAGKEKYVPAHYSCELPEDESRDELSYHRYPERWRQVSNWPHQHKVSRIPFSGETTNSSCHINCSGMQCYSQDWQGSVPLHPPFLSHNKGFSRFHPGQRCYSPYCSCPSSPQHLTDSEFPLWHSETKSDDQRHEDHRMKKYIKEKHHLAQRHLRPTAGGAPFITCYHCLKPLQLPADFLIFKRRFHQLRCGACSKVLKFSLEKRIHIVPYTPEAVAPSTSQLNDNNRRNSVSSSRGNDCSPADPMSCSDDYGPSYCRSFSTDGDPVMLAILPSLQNRDTRNMSYDSSESIKEKLFGLEQSGSKYKTPVETQKSAGPSSNKSRSGKASSEIEELSAKTASPLHQLMGYSSLSQVIRGSNPSVSGT